MFKIVIPDKVHRKIMYWVRKGAKDKHEVSGFAPLRMNEKKDCLILEDVFMLKQTNTAAETEIDPAALGKAMFRMKDHPMGLKCHWHSHPNMGVNPSSTDRTLYRQLGLEEWIVGLIFNEKAEVSAHMCSHVEVAGVKHEYFTSGLDVNILSTINTKEIEEWDKEFKECVEKKTYTTTYYPSNNYRHGHAPPAGKTKQSEWDDEDWSSLGSEGYWEDFRANIDKNLKGTGEKILNLVTGKGSAVLDLTKLRVAFIQQLLCVYADNALTVKESPSPKASFKIKWQQDGEGWDLVSGSRLYNPLRDKSVRGKDKMLEAIKDSKMDEWELFQVASHDGGFKNFCLGNLEALHERKLLDEAIGLSAQLKAQ